MSKHAIILFTGFLTLVYIAFALLLHFGWGADTTFARYVANNNLNSVGDFLAGVFSPLAFLWLIATVFIQSKELSLQRDEITENREVMKEQAKAAVAQAEFLDAQTKAMQEQTALLIKQTEISEKAATRTYKMALFEKRIEIYMEMDAIGKWISEGNYNLHQNIIDVANKSEFLFGDEVVVWMLSLAELIQTRNEFQEHLLPYRQRYTIEGMQTIATEKEQQYLNERDAMEEDLREHFLDFSLKEKLGRYLNLYEGV